MNDLNFGNRAEHLNKNKPGTGMSGVMSGLRMQDPSRMEGTAMSGMLSGLRIQDPSRMESKISQIFSESVLSQFTPFTNMMDLDVLNKMVE